VEQVREIIGVGQAEATGQIPFTPRAKQVLEAADRAGRSSASGRTGTGQLLLGLLGLPSSVALDVLKGLDIQPAAIRDQLVSVLEDPEP
jgi:ATP-dependent Clp protease ATP-binding subunit ClpC